MPASITNVSPDILYDIFELTLPTALGSPINSRVAAADFFSCTSPYNLALTSRDWRNFVLSSHSLWSSIFFSFDLPSSEDSIVLRDALERHLGRSGESPLTCFLNLSNQYKGTDTFAIIHCLTNKQKRWRRILLHVNRGISCDTLLDIKNLGMLEEFHVNNVAKCRAHEGSDIYLTSLTHLEVEVRSLRGALNWVKLAPNLQKLYFQDIPAWSLSRPHLGAVSLPALRTLGMDTYFLTSYNEDSVGTASTILAHITSRALTELRIQLNEVSCDETLLNFLRRSAPPLEVLALRVLVYTQPDDGRRENVLAQALALVPSVRKLSIEWFHFPEAIFQALSQTKTILPVLEDLELIGIVMPMEQLLEVVTSRWRSERRTLITITLTGCFSNPVHSHLSARRSFPEFAPGDDPSKLPDTLTKLREFISEGLRFSARKYIR